MTFMYPVLLAIVFLFSSCGYQLRNQEATSQNSINIPYVKGDKDGNLTNALVLEVGKSGKYRYQISDSDYTLKCEIVSNSNSNIGYEYRTKDKDTQRLNRLIPDEARRTVVAIVTIVDNKTQTAIFGPSKFQAATDYNFTNPDSYNNLTLVDGADARDTVLDFSLGQLDSQEGAQSASSTPAYSVLAEKIVQALK